MIRLLLSLAIVAAMPTLARAHGGEDHGETATSGASTGGEGQRTAFGQTGLFELVVKMAPPEAGRDASMLVFLSDFATNAPVAGAKLGLEVAAPKPVTAVAEATEVAGVYHVILKVPPGKFPVVATVEAGDQVDLVEIKEVDFAPPAEPVETSHRDVPWGLIAALGGGVLLAGAFVLALRRRAVRRGATVTTLLLVLGAPLLARAHEGEDHGDETKPQGSGKSTTPGAIYLGKESQFLLEIRTVVTSERELEARVEAVGRVVPRIDGHAEIAAPVAGRLFPAAGGRLPFIGDKVKKGQPLAIIQQTLGAAESGQVQAQAIQARSAVAQARARRDQAQRELERRRSLKGVVADKEIQQAELDVELARRELAQAEQQGTLFGSGQLQRVTITAPIDGVIAEADVAVGGQVALDKKLYSILDPTTLWVEAEVFEADLGRIDHVGAATIRVEGRDTVFPGKLYRLGQVVDPVTRTTKAIFSIDNADGALRPGTFAQVAIGAGERLRALAVPDAAVVEEGGRRFVFVHVAPEEFLKKEVVLGVRDGPVWEVRRGLEKGERVVTQGTYQVRTAR